MDDSQISCPNCDERYDDKMMKCPRCATPNPANPEAIYEENEELKRKLDRLEDELKEQSHKTPTRYLQNESPERKDPYPPGGGYVGSRDDYQYKSRKTNGKTIAAASVSAVVGIVILLVVVGIGPFSNISFRPATVDESPPENPVDTDTDAAPETPIIVPTELPEEEVWVEERVTLLDTDIFLLGTDAQTFTIEIPDEDIRSLQGMIIPEANSAVDVIFSYNEQRIEYTVFGGEVPENNREVDLPVEVGDEITLIIKTSESQPNQGFSHKIAIQLYVSYFST
jgi:hypothetical protein